MLNRMEHKDNELEELRKRRVEELKAKMDDTKKLEIEIFTSPTCPHCPAAVRATKELMEKHPELKDSVVWKEMSTVTPQGAEKARAYGIRGVPTIVITNEKGEKAGLVGAPDVKRYYDVIQKILSGE
jgi:thioredoxin 1